MTFSDRRVLHVQYEAENHTLSDRDKDLYESRLENLADVTADFPASQLHVRIAKGARSNEFDVKLSLSLARQHNFHARTSAGEPMPAFDDCVQALVDQVKTYKDKRSARGPDVDRELEVPAMHVRAPVAPDLDGMARAVAANDYVAFRDLVAIYRESLRRRIGRKVDQIPGADERIGREISLDDCVEAVFLRAFEDFDDERSRSDPEGFGDWLETRIEDAVRGLVDNPEDRRSVSFVRSAREARHEEERGQEG